MTDKERALKTLADLADDMRVTLEDLDHCERIIRTAPDDPPPGSVEVRVAVAMAIDADDGVFTEAFGPSMINQQKAMEYCGFSDATHAAIVTAWIPPRSTPEVRGRTE